MVRQHVQRSFDDLGTPLRDVTFCVIDLETTGSSPSGDRITEIGMARYRSGECIGTFQTLVDPGRPIPAAITVLTGIATSMTQSAPRIGAVLGTLVEFIGDAVVVGHNISFDLAFLGAALTAHQRPPLRNSKVDTLALARRLLRPEVPNCRLSTLASHLRLEHRPSHRALDDVLATGDLLHVLIGQAARLGVSGLDDLLSLPRLAGSAHASKLRLTERLPRAPGVYLFRDADGRVLYVGRAADLRSRVRQYFSSDRRRRTAPLLSDTERIDHKRCEHELEAAVLEVRLIHRLSPPYNSQFNRRRPGVYVEVRTTGRRPGARVVGQPGSDTTTFGPVGSRRTARAAVDALRTAPPDTDPADVLDQLDATMRHLAARQDYEQAADVRDRAVALSAVVEAQRAIDRLRRCTRLILTHRDGTELLVEHGVLRAIASPTAPGGPTAGHRASSVIRPVEAAPPDPGPPEAGPLRDDLADEIGVLARWVDHHAAELRVVEVSGTFHSERRRPRSFTAGTRGSTGAPVADRRARRAGSSERAPAS